MERSALELLSQVIEDQAVRSLFVTVIDDEFDQAEELADFLIDQGLTVTAYDSPGDFVRSVVTSDQYGVSIVDLRMPQIDGLELIRRLRARLLRPHRFIVLTGHGSRADAIEALRLGVFDFLDKPVDPEALLRAITAATESLRAEVQAAGQLPAQLLGSNGAWAGPMRPEARIWRSLFAIASIRDDRSGQHLMRVGILSETVARWLKLEPAGTRLIKFAAPLHDIGKIGVPELLLASDHTLSGDEWRVVQRHTTIGASLLAPLEGDLFRVAATIAHYHHERWEGNGYPVGLTGASIPLAARIVKLADVYDALRSERPYKEAFCHNDAVTTILAGDDRLSPSHFDPELLTLVRAHHQDFARVWYETVEKGLDDLDSQFPFTMGEI